MELGVEAKEKREDGKSSSVTTRGLCSNARVMYPVKGILLDRNWPTGDTRGLANVLI